MHVTPFISVCTAQCPYSVCTNRTHFNMAQLSAVDPQRHHVSGRTCPCCTQHWVRQLHPDCLLGLETTPHLLTHFSMCLKAPRSGLLAMMRSLPAKMAHASTSSRAATAFQTAMMALMNTIVVVCSRNCGEEVHRCS